MLAPEMQDFLAAVRRRLWRGLFVTALRRALWSSVALLVLAIALILVSAPMRVSALVLVMSFVWMLFLVWAAIRRPSRCDCALWADRHLGGASAFTTLLELDRSGTATPDTAALRRLTIWSTKKVPECLKALTERPDPVRLARPLLATIVCAALAALVLNLSDSVPPPVQQAVASLAAKAGDHSASAIGAPEVNDLAGEIAKAVRVADSSREGGRREDVRSQETANGKSVDGQSPPDGRATAMPAAAKSASASSVPPTSTPALALARTDQTTGTDSGREAGSSLDNQAAASNAYVPQGTIASLGRELEARNRSDEMQADMRRQGRYDEALTTAGQTTVLPAIAVGAAIPPTATELSRLTSTETSYVQAWLKARTQHP